MLKELRKEELKKNQIKRPYNQILKTSDKDKKTLH